MKIIRLKSNRWVFKSCNVSGGVYIAPYALPCRTGGSGLGSGWHYL